ncbi:MAG: hypothetical protein GXY33_16285 [Phycisphaerae bacterium]|nr:hypothetical protein [Phycisphaerae bacterium]
MARREVKILKYTKLGLVASILAVLAALGTLVVILHEWDSAEKVIDAGRITKPIILLGAFAAIILGFPGFLLSLEGAAGLQGKWRKLGWIGFWLGAFGAMAGLVLGLWYYFWRF